MIQTKVKMELTKEDIATNQTFVLREIQDDLPATKDKYCGSCTYSSYRNRVSCSCTEGTHDADSAVRTMGLAHFERLNAGDSVYVKAVSGGVYVGDKNKFMFSGEYISE